MHVKRKTFDLLVEAAIQALSPQFARWLDEVPVIVEDRPADADQQGAADEDEDDPLGLFTGPALTERGPEDSGSLPPRIMIYRILLMEACTTCRQLAEEIRKTLLHELGHFAGLDEADMDRLGYGPMEQDRQ